MCLGIKIDISENAPPQAVGKIKLTIFALQCLSLLCLNLASDTFTQQ